MVRGRIRSWDGLVILALEYPQHAMSKWLWRGYLHTGGHLLGRWRDSVTDEHLRGKSCAALCGTQLTPLRIRRSVRDGSGGRHLLARSLVDVWRCCQPVGSSSFNVNSMHYEALQSEIEPYNGTTVIPNGLNDFLSFDPDSQLPS
jgi:hypothetical protein